MLAHSTSWRNPTQRECPSALFPGHVPLTPHGPDTSPARAMGCKGGPCRPAREAHYLVMGKTSASRDLLVGHVPCFAGHSHGMQGGAWLRAPLAKKGRGHPKMEAGLGRLPCSPRFSRIGHSVPEPHSLPGAAPRAAD